MNTRNQLLCAHSMPVFLVSVFLGLLVMARWVPPPSPALDAAQTAALFTNNPWLRVGLGIIAFASPLYMGLAIAIAAQLMRIEESPPVMSGLQLLMNAVGVVVFQFPPLFWLGISYRPGLSPEIIQVINDISWFIFVGAVGSFVLQPVIIGLCILGNESSEEVYPRWIGYANLWLGFLFIPGALVMFFVTGPFAWNGLLTFWLALGVAPPVFILNYVYTVKAIRAQQASEQNAFASGRGIPGNVRA